MAPTLNPETLNTGVRGHRHLRKAARKLVNAQWQSHKHPQPPSLAGNFEAKASSFAWSARCAPSKSEERGWTDAFSKGLGFFCLFFVRVFSQFFSVSLFGDLLASLLRRGGTQPAEDCATIAVLCLLIDVGKVNKILGILFVITVVNTCIGMMICLICLRTTALNDCSIPKHLAVNVVPLRALRRHTTCYSGLSQFAVRRVGVKNVVCFPC